MSSVAFVFRYVVFALGATAGNLGTQRLVLRWGDEAFVYYLALLAGTLVGLVLKYCLDKRWIFGDVTSGIAEHGRKFSLYTLMGVATTAIFWGTETLFWLAWNAEAAREIGALIGLSVGYLVKYHLDRRYVFVRGQSAMDGAAC